MSQRRCCPILSSLSAYPILALSLSLSLSLNGEKRTLARMSQQATDEDFASESHSLPTVSSLIKALSLRPCAPSRSSLGGFMLRTPSVPRTELPTRSDSNPDLLLSLLHSKPLTLYENAHLSLEDLRHSIYSYVLSESCFPQASTGIVSSRQNLPPVTAFHLPAYGSHCSTPILTHSACCNVQETVR